MVLFTQKTISWIIYLHRINKTKISNHVFIARKLFAMNFTNNNFSNFIGSNIKSIYTFKASEAMLNLTRYSLWRNSQKFTENSVARTNAITNDCLNAFNNFDWLKKSGRQVSQKRIDD